VAESLAELLSRLRFTGRPVETLYLNETRIRENFIGHLGAVESFTRTASKQGSVKAPVIDLGASMSSEAEVTWGLNDPVTQVLVLRAALKNKNSIYDIGTAAPGHFVTFSGTGLVSRPGIFEDQHREGLKEYSGLYEALEDERASQESLMHLIEGTERLQWLLTVNNGPYICAAILDAKWLRPVFSHWMNPSYSVARWEIFGLCRRLHETGFPMLAMLYIGVTWAR
jgi:hypothetical protein